MNRLILTLIPSLLLTGCAEEPPVTPDPETVTYTLVDGRQFDSLQIDAFGDARDAAEDAYDEKDYAACHAAYQQAIAIYSDNERLFRDLAQCQALAGDPQGALASLARALELGFTSADRLRDDEDLESLLALPKFDQLIARIEKAAEEEEAQQIDPAAGDIHELQSFESTAVIDEFFAQQFEDRLPVIRMLGSRDRDIEMNQHQRTHVTAFQQWLESHPEDWPARFRMLEVLGDFHPRSPQYAASLKSIVANNTKTDTEPWGLVAELLLQKANLDEQWDEESTEEQEQEMTAPVTQAAQQLIGSYPNALISKYGYFHLLDQALEQDDIEGITANYAWLEAHREELPAFLEERSYTLNGAKIRTQGIPEFEAQDLDGKTWTPESMKGQVVLVDFWATWCGPCLAEMPHLKELYASHHDNGFEIFGISGDDIELDKFKAWLEEEEVPWPQNFTGDGWETELFKSFEIQGIPTAILIDRDGNIVGINLRGEDLKMKVESLMS